METVCSIWNPQHLYLMYFCVLCAGSRASAATLSSQTLETKKQKESPKINRFKAALQTVSQAARLLFVLLITPLSPSTNKAASPAQTLLSLELQWPEMASSALPVLFPLHHLVCLLSLLSSHFLRKSIKPSCAVKDLLETPFTDSDKLLRVCQQIWNGMVTPKVKVKEDRQ